jgi:hypothetical protein
MTTSPKNLASSRQPQQPRPQQQARPPQQQARPGHEPAPQPKSRRVPLEHGWAWLVEGFALWLRHPVFLSFLTFGSLITVFAASLVPEAGLALSTLLTPGLMLGVYNGCRAIDRHRKLLPDLMFSGFRHRLYDMLIASGIYFIITTGVLLGTILIDEGALWQFLNHGDEEALRAALDLPTFRYSVIAALSLLTLINVAYLFAPPLISWWRLPVPKAMLMSFTACLRNWQPFLAHSVCVVFFYFILPTFIISLMPFLVISFGVFEIELSWLVCFLFLLLTLPGLIASFYVSARDIFGLPHKKKRHAREPRERAQNA